MSATYLLDTNIVSYFLEAQGGEVLAAATRVVSLAIVDEVRGELARHPARGGSSFEHWLAASGIAVRSIPVGSDAAATLAHLLNPAAPLKDLGEYASIALATVDPALVLVTHDKNGLWRAVREIWRAPAALMGLAPFVRMLYERGVATRGELADEVGRLAGDVHRPTWWAAWRASLPSGSEPG